MINCSFQIEVQHTRWQSYQLAVVYSSVIGHAISYPSFRPLTMSNTLCMHSKLEICVQCQRHYNRQH